MNLCKKMLLSLLLFGKYCLTSHGIIWTEVSASLKLELMKMIMSFGRLGCVAGFVSVLMCLIFPFLKADAQQIIGTEGLINIPTAEMREKKTFVGGVNYVGANILYYDYPVYNYFIDFTPFRFIEMTFRSTLIKEKLEMPSDSYCEQDRSFTLRLMPLYEKKYVPGVVVGWNDFYSNMGRSYYAALYGVITKHISIVGTGVVGATVGYSKLTGSGVVYDGVFCGVDFKPSVVDCLRLMAEYDTQGCNVGAGLCIWKHWNLLAFARDFKTLGVGFSYQYTIKY